MIFGQVDWYSNVFELLKVNFCLIKNSRKFRVVVVISINHVFYQSKEVGIKDIDLLTLQVFGPLVDQLDIRVYNLIIEPYFRF